MSVVDLHPEELLDRYSAGDLTDTETLRLRAHADTCTACRFEIDARADFATDIAASHLSVGAVGPLLARPAEPERTVAHASRRSRKPVWLLAAAITLLAGGSLAAVALRVAPWSAPKTEQAPAAPATQPNAPLSRRAVTRAVHEESAAPTSVPFEALPVAPAQAPREEPARPKAADHGASELFHEATAARTRGDTGRAIALYRTLEAGYPRSPEARLSYAMLARLLLDRGDARSALDGFDTYLSQGGAAQALALGEEALVGRALALQKLGAQGGEVAAWQEVLRRFPSSVHARLARSRLSALGAR